MRVQIPTKTSRFNIPQWATKSALDKNLSASANSKKPNTTLTVVIQPPDLGRAFKAFGKSANSTKGSPKATPKPNIPMLNCIAPPSAVKEPANRDPKIGPVQEKETIASVSAIKKIPSPPRTADASSVL